MPELPEVETVKTYVHERVLHKKIKNIKVLDKKLRWPIDTKKIGNTKSKTIKLVTRRGKYILLQFDEPMLTIVIHLGMTGIIYFRKISEYKKRKHDHLVMYFDEYVLVYNDVRKFGSIHVTDEPSNMFLLRGLGPEPMSEGFNTAYLFDKAKRRTCSVKELIMNQKVVSGIGNYLKAECLYAAKISPHRFCCHISEKELQDLFYACRKIIRLSYETGGATISTYRQSNGKKGLYSRRFAVYNQKQDPFGNEVIRETTRDKRTTHWVPTVQK